MVEPKHEDGFVVKRAFVVNQIWLKEANPPANRPPTNGPHFNHYKAQN